VISRQDVGIAGRRHYNAIMHSMSKESKQTLDLWYGQDSSEKSQTISSLSLDSS